ncbi:hypothetical protein MBLNU457_1987t1 [Dothideomycetes sp. NU457]
MRSFIAALPVLAALSQVDAQGLNFGEIMSARPDMSSAKPSSSVDSSSIASSIVSSLSSQHAVTATHAKTTLATMAKPTHKAHHKTKKHSKKPAKPTHKGPVVAAAVSSSSTTPASTGSPCTPQQILYSYVPSPNTPQQFLVDSTLGGIANLALAPAGYTKQFSGLFGSMQNVQGQYLGFQQLESYNVSECVSACTSVQGCQAVNLYFERDPVVDPGLSCTNPTAATMVKCALWGGPIGPNQASDHGEYRNDFMVVIQGSNGYTKNTPPPALAGFNGPQALAGAVNINTINGQNVFLNSSFTAGVYDPSICTAQCVATTTKNKAAAVLSGSTSYAPCNYVDAFVVSYNGSALGTYCNLYTTSAVSNYATQYSQAYNGVQYDVSYSYGYTLSTVDSGVVGVVGPSASSGPSVSSSSAAASSSGSASASAASASSSAASSVSASAPAATTSASSGVASTSQTCSQLASTSSNYTDASGTTFALSCGHDLATFTNIAASFSSSFQGCFYLCENIFGCQAFTYTSGTCYFKSLAGVSTQPSVSSNVDLAYIPQYYTGLKASSSASSSAVASSTAAASSTSAAVSSTSTSAAAATTPAASSTTSASASKSSTASSTSATPASPTLVASCATLGSPFLDSNNISYNTYCGHDFQGVGDIGNAAVKSFAACFAACDAYTSPFSLNLATSNKKCQAIAYVGGSGSGTCYFKNMQGITTVPNANSGVDVAWLPSAYSYTVPQ